MGDTAEAEVAAATAVVAATAAGGEEEESILPKVDATHEEVAVPAPAPADHDPSQQTGDATAVAHPAQEDPAPKVEDVSMEDVDNVIVKVEEEEQTVVVQDDNVGDKAAPPVSPLVKKATRGRPPKAKTAAAAAAATTATAATAVAAVAPGGTTTGGGGIKTLGKRASTGGYTDAASGDAVAVPSDQQHPPAKKRRQSSKKAKVATGNWNDQFFELMKYRAEFHNVAVPASYAPGALGQWVTDQRREFRSYRRNKGEDSSYSGPLSPDRVQVLDSLGFVWDTVKEENEHRWEKQYQQLVEYQKVNGHCNVPQSTDLGKWVKLQREQKVEADLKQAGKRPQRSKPRPCLNEERQKKLNAIGFAWRVAKPVVGWENRFRQLLEYRALYGHVNVPQSYPPDKSFGRWVMKQRCEYNLKKRGEKSQMTDERIQRLEAVNFQWVAPHLQKTSPDLDIAALGGGGAGAAAAATATNSGTSAATAVPAAAAAAPPAVGTPSLGQTNVPPTVAATVTNVPPPPPMAVATAPGVPPPPVAAPLEPPAMDVAPPAAVVVAAADPTNGVIAGQPPPPPPPAGAPPVVAVAAEDPGLVAAAAAAQVVVDDAVVLPPAAPDAAALTPPPPEPHQPAEASPNPVSAAGTVVGTATV